MRKFWEVREEDVRAMLRDESKEVAVRSPREIAEYLVMVHHIEDRGGVKHATREERQYARKARLRLEEIATILCAPQHRYRRWEVAREVGRIYESQTNRSCRDFLWRVYQFVYLRWLEYAYPFD